MNGTLRVNISDDEDSEGCRDNHVDASASPPKPLASPPEVKRRQSAVYVSYPCSVVHLHGVDAAPIMPSTVGPHNGFLRTYKILLVGEAAVGKSNLISRYCHNKYDPTLQSTLGAEFCSREVRIPAGSVGQTERVVLQLWDTAGQERNAGVISNAFYRNAVGAIVVYDVTRRETLLNVPRWVARVMELAREDCVCVVVGTKVDLLKTPQGTPLSKTEMGALQLEADRISHALGLRNFFASALSGEGVLEVFTHLVLAVDAVQAAPQAARAARAEVMSEGSEMWTAASTVPASPLALFSSLSTHRLADELSPERHLNTSRSVASASQCPPVMTPSTPGYMSPGAVGNTSLPASPFRAKKSLDLRGFGPGEDGNAAAPEGGAGESFCGC